MLILIYGEDTYRSREWLHELISKFKTKFDPPGYNLSRFGGATEPAELRAAITAPPFLATRRMVVVERLLERAGKDESLEEILTTTPESSIVVLWEEGEEKTFAKTPLFAKLVRDTEVKTYPFQPLSGASLLAWVREQSSSRGVSFDRGALQELIRRTGSDLWQLTRELDKFAALRKTVSAALVAEYVRGQTPENIFGFIDAIVARDKVRAVQELMNERAHGTAFPYLIAMCARQFRMLRAAFDYVQEHERASPQTLVKLFGWHPFVARKTLSQIRAFDRQTLDRLCDTIFETDRDIKIGTYEAETAVDLLMAKLLGVTS